MLQATSSRALKHSNFDETRKLLQCCLNETTLSQHQLAIVWCLIIDQIVNFNRAKLNLIILGAPC